MREDWDDAEWLVHLQRRACRFTACADDAADLTHDCLIAFVNHFTCYPWEYADPLHAWRWCCLKLRALAADAHRHAQRHPSLSLEEAPESLACVEIAEQVQGDVDGEAFVAQLPPRLRAVVQLRLQGFSWEAIARQLGVKASTLRGYLPELRARFVAFFGYDPSNRAFESLIEVEGTDSPSVETGGDGDASDKQGFRGGSGSA
ncbi:DNA-directed RNA polymerase specialized sigma subunit, sigma24 family [Armatimonadetes bacterium DC]|nr:DNA-directed RNA polymerase specialized sigma subunit, sigma24 family [Armatimonadetes bacterium DC]